MNPPTFHTFSSPGGPYVHGVTYILDTISGVFRPAYSTDLAGSLTISGIRVDISGIEVNTDELEGMAISGDQYLAHLSGQLTGVSNTLSNLQTIETSGVEFLTLLSGKAETLQVIQTSGTQYLASISGKVNTILPISGNVNVINTPYVTLSNSSVTINNTSPIPFSGVVQANVTNTAPLPISGLVQSNTASATSHAGISGISNQGWGVALPLNPSRKAWGIQNIGTGIILVNFSSTIPTTTNTNLVLKGGTVSGDGLGAMWTEYPCFFVGPVAVSGNNSDFNPAYSIWEL